VNSSAPAITLESVSKRYGSRNIIHDLSFAVRKGEIVGFLGPNGAGKTTTMRMIAGFTTATSGTVTVAGYDMATGNEEAARSIGYLPEQPPLYDVLEVSAYLRFVAKVKGVSRPAVAGELERVIHACRLEAVVDREIYKLSKGYRQRVGLAQALLGQPEVLLLDEPTAGLDPSHARSVFEMLRAQCDAGSAAVVVTHDLDLALRHGRTMWLVADGKLAARGTPADVLASAATRQAFKLDIHVGDLPSGTRFAVPA
jgi:ABC-2 type transport system ATP-binding protein